MSRMKLTICSRFSWPHMSMESAKVSQPLATPKILNIETQNVKEETEVCLHDEKFLTDLSRKTTVTKKDFKDTGHLKSGRYYLPESTLLTIEGRQSGLLANLTIMAAVYPNYINVAIYRCQWLCLGAKVLRITVR